MQIFLLFLLLLDLFFLIAFRISFACKSKKTEVRDRAVGEAALHNTVASTDRSDVGRGMITVGGWVAVRKSSSLLNLGQQFTMQ